ncbi:MAG: MFS transporter [Pseudomonadota bacterium]
MAQTQSTLPHEDEQAVARRRDRCAPERRKFVLIAAILASALGFIDGTIVAIALPQMRASLGADFAGAQWISNSYMLMLTALVLLGGAMGDKLGLRRTFSFGIALFTVASIACALATTTPMMIFFRAIQGMGAAIMVPGSMALIAKHFPREERGKALGVWVAASSVTTAMGPLLGGLVLTYGGPETWRWLFGINLPVGLFIILLLRAQVPDDRPAARDGLGGLDWAGAALATCALGALALGLTWLGEGGGSVGLAAFAIILGTGVLGFALWWEWRMKRVGGNPMVDLDLFQLRPFWGANLFTLFVWASIGAVTFFLPMLVIVAWQLPESYAGTMFLAFSLTVSPASIVVGRLVGRMGSRFFMTLGAFTVVVAHLTIAWGVAVQSYFGFLVPGLALLGLGIGLSASPLSTAIVNAVDEDHQGEASGINNTVARMGQLYAVAGLGALVAYVYQLMIRGSSLPADIQNAMIEEGYGERLTGGLYQVATVDLQAVAMTHATVVLFMALALLATLGMVTAFFTQEGRSVQ